MKALVQEKCGSPDVLELRDVDQPVVQDDQVLVRVHAAAVNPADVHFMTGLPYVFRPLLGLRKPKIRVRGTDVAGHVEAVGRNVKLVHPGDEVFGGCDGALAEYVSGGEKKFAPKPANLTFEQAAAVPVAACTALQALRDVGHLQPGQTVLINGASGGVGTFAVQLAKALGAEVTGVCSTRNVDLVHSLGADHVIDYTQEDFTQSGRRYDLILDHAANHALSELRRVLTPTGTLIPNSDRSGGR
jgi:NADPH:quinone reductase-like Zn-dependent oxidoreductase